MHIGRQVCSDGSLANWMKCGQCVVLALVDCKPRQGEPPTWMQAPTWPSVGCCPSSSHSSTVCSYWDGGQRRTKLGSGLTALKQLRPTTRGGSESQTDVSVEPLMSAFARAAGAESLCAQLRLARTKRDGGDLGERPPRFHSQPSGRADPR